MALRADLALVVATLFLFLVGFASACEGKTIGGEGEGAGGVPGEDSGIHADSGIGTSATESGSTCVDIEVASSDLSCSSDQDCSLIRTGEVCNGQCDCGDTPVNAAASARYRSETASLVTEDCPCDDPGEPRCLGGQCTLCGFGPNAPLGCNDAGVTTTEDSGFATVDGGEPDTGTWATDGGTCVDIDLSTYDQSCNQATDCIVIRAGEVCSGQCACDDPLNPLTVVNASEQSRYEQATSGIDLDAVCPCPPATLQCVGNMCSSVVPP
jgi:hypothetical protein